MCQPLRAISLVFCLGVLSVSGCATRREPTPLRASPSSAPAADLATVPASTPLLGGSASTNAPVETASQAGTSTSASKKGWWVRINGNLTQAQAVTLQIGTHKLNREEWRIWRAGEVTEFDVPEKFQNAPRLYLRGSVAPIGRMADLCLMYKDRGVEHMDFYDDESETKSQLAVDYKCRL